MIGGRIGSQRIKLRKSSSGVGASGRKGSAAVACGNYRNCNSAYNIIYI
jgi:hypothetical protein